MAQPLPFADCPAKPRGIIFGAVILAAGASSRMGRPKLLLPWNGSAVLEVLIGRWVELGAAQVAIVLAPDSELNGELDRLAFPAANRIVNPQPARGMFSSIQCAASWAGWGGDLTHFVLALGDQPHLRLETLQTLLEFAAQHPDHICQPVYLERPKHPVVFPKNVFADLASAPLQTLKQFLQQRNVARCEMADPGLALDIDRPEDYQAALDLRDPKGPGIP